MTRRVPIEPPRWTTEQLEADRRRAVEDFRRERMEEPLDVYLRAFDERQAAFEDLLETTVDLTELGDHATAILTDRRLLEALRYLAGPPVSLDDLKTLADVPSLAPGRLRADPALAHRLVETVVLGVDRRRFLWLSEGREPTESERASAILASAALIASQRAATARRSEGKSVQERKVEEALLAHGFTRVVTRNITTLDDAPNSGEFCKESTAGSRKADIVVPSLGQAHDAY